MGILVLFKEAICNLFFLCSKAETHKNRCVVASNNSIHIITPFRTETNGLFSGIIYKRRNYYCVQTETMFDIPCCEWLVSHVTCSSNCSAYKCTKIENKHKNKKRLILNVCSVCWPQQSQTKINFIHGSHENQLGNFRGFDSPESF